MEMAQEMMGDTLDSALDDETTEDDAAELVGQVSRLDAWLRGASVGDGGAACATLGWGCAGQAADLVLRRDRD
jgi:predicted RNA methylase